MGGDQAVKSIKARLKFWLCHLLGTWPWTSDTATVTLLLKGHRHVTEWETKISPEKYRIVHLLVCLSSISYFGNRMKLSFRNRLFSTFNPCGWDWPQSPSSKMGTGTRPSTQESTLWPGNGLGVQLPKVKAELFQWLDLGQVISHSKQFPYLQNDDDSNTHSHRAVVRMKTTNQREVFITVPGMVTSQKTWDHTQIYTSALNI